MKRGVHIVLVGVFLLLIFGVPLAQGILEKLRGERPAVLALFSRPPSEANLRALERELEESSFAAQAVRPAFQLARYALLRELGEKALRGRDGFLFYAPEVRYLVEPYFRELRPAPVDDPVETIVDFAAQLRGRGIELLLVPIPSKPAIYPDRLVPALRPTAALSVHTLRFSAELRRRGLAVVELHRPFFAARSSRPGPLYLATDTHWTGDGARLAAAIIASHLRHKAWYRALAPRPRYERRSIRVLRQGDIPRMTQIPLEERLFGRETVTCHRVLERGSGAPYTDAESSPILLLGDSFSRIYQTDEPEAAGLIANLAFELQLPLSSIVNDGGASTLVRQELARDLGQLRGKRLVIWAFAERDIRFGLQGWARIQL